MFRRKAKLPTTLVAVRAHPKSKLRFKLVMDLANGSPGTAWEPGWKLDRTWNSSLSVWVNDWEMAEPLQIPSRRIMKKIRVFGLRPNITSTFLNGVAMIV